MVISDTAKRRNISNQPTAAHLKSLEILAHNILQPIRDHFEVPIHLSSVYRSHALNVKIGGASSSQHCRGEAADIDMDNTSVTNKEIFEFIREKLPFDQLIWEFGNADGPDWVHVSFNPSGKQRGEVLRAYRSGTSTKYTRL